MSTEPKHYELGGSNAYRWRNCPGSVNLLRGLPSPPSGAAAIEGTDAHAWCEFFLQNPAFLHVLSFVGKKRPGDKESTVALTVEMATGVKLYVDYVKSFSDQYGAELFCEAKVLLSELSDRMGGTIDARVFARRYTEPIEVDSRWVFPAYHALDKLIERVVFSTSLTSNTASPSSTKNAMISSCSMPMALGHSTATN